MSDSFICNRWLNTNSNTNTTIISIFLKTDAGLNCGLLSDGSIPAKFVILYVAAPSTNSAGTFPAYMDADDNHIFEISSSYDIKFCAIENLGMLNFYNINISMTNGVIKMTGWDSIFAVILLS